jgi:hypothetical protein
MSPALAHRDPNHNELIQSMTEQMVELLLESSGNSGGQTSTGVRRVGTWEELTVEDSDIDSTGGQMQDGICNSKSRLSKSLALALAQAAAVPNPSSAPNYEGSFGYVEPPPVLRMTKQFVPNIDLSFTLQGIPMTLAEIKFADRCNNCSSAVRLLQRYQQLCCPTI